MTGTKKIKTKLDRLPEEPGVYFFKDARGRILYVGKATSLKDRVRSYFTGDITKSRSQWIAKMLEQVTDLKVKVSDSALEALIEEAAYIKQYQPPFNSRAKDNKSFIYVVITDEAWPRILIKRARELEQGQFDFAIKSLFGPYPSGSSLREALKIIRKIFPFRDRCSPFSELKGQDRVRACFNYALGLCPGVCIGAIDSRAYRTRISHIEQFLQGRKRQLIKKLERQMRRLADQQEFEQAEQVKHQINSLRHIQDVALLKRDFLVGSEPVGQHRLESFDVAHSGGRSMVAAMTVLVNGQPDKSQYRKFKIRSVDRSNDTAALREVLNRRLKHSEWGWPDLLVVDGGEAQRRTALSVLKEGGWSVPVVAVVKDQRHKPKAVLGPQKVVAEYKDLILKANHETHRFALGYHRQSARRQFGA